MEQRADFDALIAAARRGETRAWTLIYRNLAPHLLTYLIEHQARGVEEMLGETFVDLARTLPRFEGDKDDFVAFAFATARTRLAISGASRGHTHRASRVHMPTPTEHLEAAQLRAVLETARFLSECGAVEPMPDGAQAEAQAGSPQLRLPAGPSKPARVLLSVALVLGASTMTARGQLPEPVQQGIEAALADVGIYRNADDRSAKTPDANASGTTSAHDDTEDRLLAAGYLAHDIRTEPVTSVAPAAEVTDVGDSTLGVDAPGETAATQPPVITPDDERRTTAPKPDSKDEDDEHEDEEDAPDESEPEGDKDGERSDDAPEDDTAPDEREDDTEKDESVVSDLPPLWP